MKLIYVLLFILLAGATLWIFQRLSGGELADKPVYAALQGVELEFRGKSGADLIYEERAGHLLAGFSAGAQERVWVALSSRKDGGDLLIIPEHGERNIPCHLIDQLEASKVGDSQVRSTLRASCMK